MSSVNGLADPDARVFFNLVIHSVIQSDLFFLHPVEDGRVVELVREPLRGTVVCASASRAPGTNCRTGSGTKLKLSFELSFQPGCDI